MNGYEIVVTGCSHGGLSALKLLLGELPRNFSLPIVIAQHRGPEMGISMSDLLRRYSQLPVRETEDKDDLEPGNVYLAPPDYHLLVERGSLALSLDAPVASARPSIDVLFGSAAAAYGPAVVGVLLTGASHDGAQGLARIKEKGGYAVVQEPATAENPVMPAAGIAATKVDNILPLERIPDLLVKLAAQSPRIYG